MNKDNSVNELAQTKIWADSEKYFSLFDRHVPSLGKGRTVLLYSIDNVDCILKIVAKNPDASYVVYGNPLVNRMIEGLLPTASLIDETSENRKAYNIDMNFDCIIMNPPYDKNLHLKILAEAIKHLKDDESKVVNLSPVRWLQDPIAKYKKNSDYNKFEETISQHLKEIDVIDAKTATDIFNVPFWNDMGVYVADTAEYSWYADYARNTSKFWSLIEKIGLPLFQNRLGDVCRIYDRYSLNVSMPYFIKCSRVHGHVGQVDQYDCITPRFDLVFNKKGHEGREVYFSSKDEAVSFFNTMNLKFFKFIKYMGCWPTDDFNKGLPWMGDSVNPRTGLKGYQSEWTDEDFYKFFTITDDEKKIIEETMAKYVKK